MATNSKFIADIGIKTDSDLQIGGNTTIDGNATVSGNLTVNGTSTTINATTTSVEDNMLELANANTSSDTLDIGIYGNYDDGLSDGGATEYTGLFRDASDSTWKLFDGLEVAPTTTVNTSGTGYTLADLTVGDLTATTLTATNGLTGSSITYPTTDGTNGQVIKTNGSGTLTFGDIPAGYTDSDARSAISVSGDLSYNSSTGVISYSDSDTTYTDSDARGAISAGTGISYNSSTGVITSTVSGGVDGITSSADATAITIDSAENVEFVNNIRLTNDKFIYSYNGGATTGEVRAGFKFDGTNEVISVYTNQLERMRIDSAGSVGIGKTPNRSRKLEVAGTMNLDDGSEYEWGDGSISIAGNSSTDVMTFATAGAERMRIEADGQVQVSNVGGVRLDAVRGSRFGYSSAYRCLVLGGSGATTSDNLAIGYDPSTNASGSFTGYGESIYFRNDVTLRTPNTANNGFHSVMTFEDGNVKMPTQPSFFCYPSASFTASGGSVKYTFAGEAHDSNNEYNHSTGKFTAPTSGRYMFLCNLAIESSTSELTYAGIGVRKNNTGSVYFGGWADKQSTTSGHYAQASSSIIMYLAQGDYVELYIELSGSHTILGGNNGAYTRFCGQLLS